MAALRDGDRVVGGVPGDAAATTIGQVAVGIILVAGRDDATRIFQRGDGVRAGN